MSEDREFKFNIHFGGSMLQKDGKYVYDGGRTELKSVVWKKSEIEWSSFEDVIIQGKVNVPIALIWFKLQSEGMEKLQYAFDRIDGELCRLTQLISL